MAADVVTEPSPQGSLGHGEAHRVREALAEGAGRDLDTMCVADLGMARRARSPLAKLFEIFELEAIPGEIQHAVEQDRRVARRQHETITIGPVRIGRVVVHDAGPQHVGQWGQRHRGALVT